MESKAMPGGMCSSMQPGMSDLEMSLHHPIPPQNPHHIQQQQQQPHSMVAYGHHDGDYHPQTQQGYPFTAKSKNQSLSQSDDDEPGLTAENSADDGKRKMSPWERMKWTDNMARSLIMVVFYVGDEVGSEGNDPASKKKGGGALPKKGKWKSVSQVMTERGFYVSPQQCEDKFNDLNKSYKRVNDILGKGTACRVVENQSLLDTMDQLSPKMKDEVKKLLNSKHFFFREMCAYHNSCGHGSGASKSGTDGVQHSPPEAAAEGSQSQLQLHSTENTPVMPNIKRAENEVSKLAKATSGEDDEDDEDDDDDVVFGGGSGSHDHGYEDDINDTDEMQRKGTFHSPLIQQLDAEFVNMLQDGRKSPFEKRQWMKKTLMLLEEQRLGIQSQALELEKQRLKWLKFSTKKERAMEREKLTNEGLKLENERMVLLIRQQELDFLDHDHHQQRLAAAFLQQED